MVTMNNKQAQNKAPLMSEGLLSPFQVSNVGKREKNKIFFSL